MWESCEQRPWLHLANAELLVPRARLDSEQVVAGAEELRNGTAEGQNVGCPLPPPRRKASPVPEAVFIHKMEPRLACSEQCGEPLPTAPRAIYTHC